MYLKRSMVKYKKSNPSSLSSSKIGILTRWWISTRSLLEWPHWMLMALSSPWFGFFIFARLCGPSSLSSICWSESWPWPLREWWKAASAIHSWREPRCMQILCGWSSSPKSWEASATCTSCVLVRIVRPTRSKAAFQVLSVAFPSWKRSLKTPWGSNRQRSSLRCLKPKSTLWAAWTKRSRKLRSKLKLSARRQPNSIKKWISLWRH